MSFLDSWDLDLQISLWLLIEACSLYWQLKSTAALKSLVRSFFSILLVPALSRSQPKASSQSPLAH